MPEKGLKPILVVDDDEMIRSIVKEFLKTIGYDCEIATDAFEALYHLKANYFNLVISDIMMPGKDGIQFMREAKETFPNLDFIIMTGYSSQYEYIDIINAGAADYMSKPFEMSELQAKVLVLKGKDGWLMS